MEYLRDVASSFRGINPTKAKKQLLFTLLHVLIHLTRCRSWMARFNNKSVDLSNFKSDQTILMNQYVNIVVFAITSRVLSAYKIMQKNQLQPKTKTPHLV